MAGRIPTYGLYGEAPAREPAFWLHAETIPIRSRLHHWEIRPHRHESFLQILHLEAGEGEVAFQPARHLLRPPVAVVIPPGCEHGLRFSSDVDGTIFTVLASRLRPGLGEGGRLHAWLAAPSVIALAGADAGDRDAGVDAEQDAAHAVATLRRLGREARERRRGGDELMDSYLTVVLTLFARLSMRDSAREDVKGPDTRLELLEGLLRRHLRAQRPASFYARELGVSVTHLSRLVRAATGHGFHELTARMLMEEARGDLLFTATSVQEVSYRLGFADPAYFSRFFTRRAGMTPGRFRQVERARFGM